MFETSAVGREDGQRNQLELKITGQPRSEQPMNWFEPPPILSKLLIDLFVVQPVDSLSWIHEAVWKLHVSECAAPEAGRYTIQDCGDKSIDNTSRVRQDLAMHPWLSSQREFSDFNQQVVDEMIPEEHPDITPLQVTAKLSFHPVDEVISDDLSENAPHEDVAAHATKRLDEVGASDISICLDFSTEAVKPPEPKQSEPGERQLVAERQVSAMTVNSGLSGSADDGMLHRISLGSKVSFDSAERINRAASESIATTVYSERLSEMESSKRGSRSMGTQSYSTRSVGFAAVPYSTNTTDANSTSSVAMSWTTHFVTKMSPGVGRSSRGSRLSYAKWGTIDLDSIGDEGYLCPLCVLISPLGRFRFFWNTVFLACLLFELWEIGLQCVFLATNADTGHHSISILTLCVFICDIVLTLCTATVSKFGLEVRLKIIAVKYLIGFFWVDISSTAAHIACLVHDRFDDGIWILLLLRSLRVVRLSRGLQWSAWLQARLPASSNIFLLANLLKLHVAMVLLVHLDVLICAPLQSDFSASGDFEQARSAYLETFCFVYGALTYGADPFSSGISGQLSGIMISLQRIAIVMFTVLWLARHVTYTVCDGDAITSKEEALGYLQSRHVTEPMRHIFLSRIEEASKVQRRQRQCKKLPQLNLPRSFQKMICFELWEAKFMRFELLRLLGDLHEAFIVELALGVHEEHYVTDVVLIKPGDASSHAYLVLTGRLSVFKPDSSGDPRLGMARPDVLPGMWIGEQGFINPELLQTETMTCCDIVELTTVPAVHFRAVIEKLGLFEHFEQMVRKSLWKGLCGRCGTLGDHFSDQCNSRRSLSPRRMESRLSVVSEGSLKSFRLPSRKNKSYHSNEEEQLMLELRTFMRKAKVPHMVPLLMRHGVNTVEDLIDMSVDEKLQELVNDPEEDLPTRDKELFRRAVVQLQKDLKRNTNRILAFSGSTDNHLMFISHYKKEAGTEATLLQAELEKIIKEDPSSPGHGLKAPVFIDSENLRDLDELEDHVKKSHNLVVLLTPGVLSRPWVLVEIITAIQTGVYIVLVEIQRPDLAFVYPDEAYFQRLCDGQELDDNATNFLQNKGFDLRSLEHCLRQMFKHIAVPFSPHKAHTIRSAEVKEVLKKCTLRNVQKTSSDSTGRSSVPFSIADILKPKQSSRSHR